MTVRLPWAAAIRAATTPGRGKPVENRGRPIPARYIGERIGLHAAAAWSKEGAADRRIGRWRWGSSWAHRRQVDPTDFPGMARHVIAVVKILGCHQAAPGPDGGTCCKPWGDRFYIDQAKTAWHIELGDAVPLAEPVGPVAGKLSVPWELPRWAAELVSDRFLDAP
jgi:hypothetical protein